MAIYSFVPPFRKVKFCGVPSCVFDKLGCAAGEKSLWNTYLENEQSVITESKIKFNNGMETLTTS
jgi:hypothetical protein